MSKDNENVELMENKKRNNIKKELKRTKKFLIVCTVILFILVAIMRWSGSYILDNFGELVFNLALLAWVTTLLCFINLKSDDKMEVYEKELYENKDNEKEIIRGKANNKKLRIVKNFLIAITIILAIVSLISYCSAVIEAKEIQKQSYLGWMLSERCISRCK